MTTFNWNNPSGGNFNTATDWTPNGTPGASDDADISAVSSTDYTVTANTDETVGELQTGTAATLAIVSGNFTDTDGTGAGANAGTISLGGSCVFSFGGTIDNSNPAGIGLASLGNATGLIVGAVGATLSGGGAIILDDSIGNRIYGAARGDTLTNVDNTISGAGALGENKLTLINQAKGVIDATGTLNALTIFRAAANLTNSGLIESTGAGGLDLVSTTIDGAGGTIVAGGGSAITVHGSVIDGADILGGLLKSSGAGKIETSTGTNIVDGTATQVNNEGTLSITGATGLILDGSIANSGMIALAGKEGRNAYLTIGMAGVILSGGGSMTMGVDAAGYIFGASAGATLTNVDNTISGAGFLGNGYMALVNQAGGMIDARARRPIRADPFTHAGAAARAIRVRHYRREADSVTAEFAMAPRPMAARRYIPSMDTRNSGADDGASPSLAGCRRLVTHARNPSAILPGGVLAMTAGAPQMGVWAFSPLAAAQA